MAFIWLILGPAVGGLIGSKRANVALGILLGVLLGPVGWIIIWFIDDRPRCPDCNEPVNVGAFKCPHCGYDTRTEEHQSLT